MRVRKYPKIKILRILSPYSSSENLLEVHLFSSYTQLWLFSLFYQRWKQPWFLFLLGGMCPLWDFSLLGYFAISAIWHAYNNFVNYLAFWWEQHSLVTFHIPDNDELLINVWNNSQTSVKWSSKIMLCKFSSRISSPFVFLEIPSTSNLQ